MFSLKDVYLIKFKTLLSGNDKKNARLKDINLYKYRDLLKLWFYALIIVDFVIKILKA